MKYTSEIIQKVVTSEACLQALERISPIYADAENFLHLLNAIGTQLDVLVGHGSDIWNEITPQTSNKLIEYWEKEYGLVSDTTLTVRQRRDRVLAKIRSKPPMNKYKFEAIVSAAAGVNVSIDENIGKNTFKAYVYTKNESGLINGEIAVRNAINRAKPAHLIYTISYADILSSNMYVGGAVKAYKNITIRQGN